MCVGVLHARVKVSDPLDWSYRQLCYRQWVLRTGPRPLEEQAVLLPAESSLQL